MGLTSAHGDASNARKTCTSAECGFKAATDDDDDEDDEDEEDDDDEDEEDEDEDLT